MNIIQLFDVLKIDKNQISIYSDFDVIKIEKEINVEKKINPDIDANIANNLVQALKNHKNELSFIVNNRTFFNLFSGKILPRSEFNLQPIAAKESTIVSFIDLYLKDDLVLFFDKNVSQNKFDIVTDVLAEKRFIPEDVLYKLDKRIQGKIDFAISKMQQVPMDLSDVNYVKRSSFYDLLSAFSSLESDEKIRFLLNEVVNQYNQNKSSEFFSTTLITMPSYKAFDDDLNATLNQNRIAAISNENRDSGSSRSSDSGFGISGRSIFFIVLAFIKILLLLSKCDDNNSSSQQFDQDLYNQNQSNSGYYNSQTMYNSQENQMNYNMINFADFLVEYQPNEIKNVKIAKKLKSGDNPFRKLYSSSQNNVPVGLEINFKNNTNFELIVLSNLRNSLDFASPCAACYIKPHENARILRLPSEKCAYHFYFGKNLASFDSQNSNRYKNQDSLTIYRFLNLAKNSKEIVKQELHFTKDVTIDEKNGEISWMQKIN